MKYIAQTAYDNIYSTQREIFGRPPSTTMSAYLLLALALAASTHADDDEVRCLPGFVKSVDGQCYNHSNRVKRVSGNTFPLFFWMIQAPMSIEYVMVLAVIQL